jgi:hypothetical protein
MSFLRRELSSCLLVISTFIDLNFGYETNEKQNNGL